MYIGRIILEFKEESGVLIVFGVFIEISISFCIGRLYRKYFFFKWVWKFLVLI